MRAFGAPGQMTRSSAPHRYNTCMDATRREFLAAAALAPLAASAPADEPWFDRPMRWAQLTLVEDDPGKFDLNFWLDYFRRTHSDAACLSAGGCVAYYPTKVPLHYRSHWLGSSDPFGDLVEGCRKMGMNGIGRTDPDAEIGCFPYYPTKVPLHYRSHWLGSSDPFGDLVAGCRKLGMNVIARTDPHAADRSEEHTSELHPR